MSTVSRVQHLLGVLTHARVNHHPVQMVTPRVSHEPAPVKAAAPVTSVQSTAGDLAKAPSWDPHEVWMNRVKKPRDQRSA